MAEYIDREVLIKTTRETPFTMSMCLTVEECKGMNEAREILADIFEILPAADVAPVVRCKDCKHGTRLVCDLAGNEGIECRHGNIAHRLDWFCADGAKMDGGET